MKGLRLAFVTRRFWPLVGENELRVASLAAELLRRGHLPTIITPKYDKYWPANVCLREVPVLRLPHPPPRTWGNVRYSFAMSRWLQQRQRELDAVIVIGSQEDALTALGAVRSSGVALVVEVELGGNIDGSPRRFGEQLLHRLQACDAFVLARGNEEAARLEQLPEWMPPEKTHRIEPGVELPPARTPAAKAAARQALADVNHDLATAPDAPVGLCLTPLIAEAHLDQLARAWRMVQSRWSEARLWIVGDGPRRSALFTLLSDLNLKYRIVLPGTFDDWDTLVQAADLLVQPAHGASSSLAQRHAMAAGLPLVVYRSHEPTTPLPRETSQPVGASNSALWHVHRSEGDQLATRLAFLLEHPAEAVKLGEQGRRIAASQYGLSAMVDAYEQLLATVVARRRNEPGPA